MAKFIKLFIVVIVIIFFVMVFTSSSGYYEYELNKKANLTQEAIKQFEEDVKEGKEIDVKDYFIVENKDYSNKFSKAGLKISNKIGSLINNWFQFIFNSIGKMVEE